MSNITADIKGIIRELSLSPSDFLIPLFEMVVNAIQAIEENNQIDKKGKGRIRIEILRDKSQQTLFPNQTNYPISSIKITDDGIGFTKENYQSYSIAYSAKKQKVGGKGIGRFAALSVFSSIEVESVCCLEGKRTKKRFSLSTDSGLTSPVDMPSNASQNTTVALNGLKPDFIKSSSKYTKEAIAEAVLSHCLLFFINGQAPVIEILEDGVIINLDNRYHPSQFIKKSDNSIIKGQSFDLYFIPNKKKQRYISYCANSRRVKSKKTVSILPIFSSPLQDMEGKEIFYDIYVVSEYLDNIVNSSRTDLKFPKEDSDDTLPGTSSTLPTEKDVEEMVKNSILDVFSEEIASRKAFLKKNVQEYIDSDEEIGYRYLTLGDDFYNCVPDDVSEKKLSDILHEEEFKHSKKRREAWDKLKERDYTDTPEYKDLINDYIALSSGEGVSKLGQYIAHRKVIIELLDRYLQWSDDNQNYEEEEVLHNLIYTMGGNHASINYDFHNLWLLDDRLTFHKYIYSDKQIKSHTPVEGMSDSKKETDIAIYDTVFHYGEKDSYEEVKSVVIFELKRPNRSITYFDFYKQMSEQLAGVESGKSKDHKGRNIHLPEHAPLTFYFVCDSNTFEMLKDPCIKEGYVLTPYNTLLRIVNLRHVEIMTYQTILINAKRRNRIFFDKLGIPN